MNEINEKLSNNSNTRNDTLFILNILRPIIFQSACLRLRKVYETNDDNFEYSEWCEQKDISKLY